MKHSTSAGLVVAVIAAMTFGVSGAVIKPLLESGWSPAAAVTTRAFIGGFVLLPFALFALRGRWGSIARARWRILAMAFIGVVGTQLVYFAAVQRIPVNTAILVEYMAPLLLVIFVSLRSRRFPRLVVLAGSVVATAGLVLVVSPSGEGSLDLLGVGFAALAALGCAVYFVVAARPSDGLPPVALAAFGLLGGATVLALVGLTGLVPFTARFGSVDLLGAPAPWWVPLLIVGVVATAIAYAASITATEMLGSRLASFAGLLEVIAAALYAWLLLGENLTVLQFAGGALILVGIALVRAERTAAMSPALEPDVVTVQPTVVSSTSSAAATAVSS